MQETDEVRGDQWGVRWTSFHRQGAAYLKTICDFQRGAGKRGAGKYVGNGYEIK